MSDDIEDILECAIAQNNINIYYCALKKQAGPFADCIEAKEIGWEFNDLYMARCVEETIDNSFDEIGGMPQEYYDCKDHW